MSCVVFTYLSIWEEPPHTRTNTGTLRTCLRKKAKAVLQFYPETAEDCHLICRVAKDVGFTGGLLVDYPAHMDGKKYFLVISFNG